jgi:hypothetical protein
MAVNPAFQIMTAWGSLFAVSLGRNVIEGFLGRLFHGRPLQAVGFVVLVGAVVVLGGDWLLVRFGRTTAAAVVAKQDLVEVQRDGSWSRELTIQASYQPRGWSSRAVTTVPVGAAVYDLVQQGQQIPVRCVPLAPTFCLLKYDSVREWALRSIDRALDRDQSLFVLGLPIVVFWLGIAEWNAARPIRRWGSRLLFAGWAFLLLRAVAVPQGPAPSAGGSPVAARVRDVHFVSHYELLSPMIRIPLAHPYAVVQLALTPAGRRDTVVAVDLVDSVTAVQLQPARAFMATYPATDPRAATLNGARRDFRTGNVTRNVLLTLGLLLILVVPVVLIELTRAPVSPPPAPAAVPSIGA